MTPELVIIQKKGRIRCWRGCRDEKPHIVGMYTAAFVIKIVWVSLKQKNRIKI